MLMPANAPQDSKLVLQSNRTDTETWIFFLNFQTCNFTHQSILVKSSKTNMADCSRVRKRTSLCRMFCQW